MVHPMTVQSYSEAETQKLCPEAAAETLFEMLFHCPLENSLHLQGRARRPPVLETFQALYLVYRLICKKMRLASIHDPH